MINDYNEFCDYIKLIYEKSHLLNESNAYTDRMINIFARRFTFPFLDEKDPTTFKNDFYSLINKEANNPTRNCKDRLAFSANAIKYLYTGIYGDNENGKGKFIEFLSNYLNDVPYGKELIDKYEQLGEKGYNPKNIIDWKIYNANRDASYTGPLRMNIGVKYTIEDFNLIYKLSLEAEEKTEKDKSNVAKIAIMLLSYYYFYKSKRNCKYVPFTLETMKTWYTSSGHTWFGVKSNKHSVGFQGTHLLSVENQILEKGTGMYATDSDLSLKIKPEIITLDSNHKHTYLTEDGKYVVFVDEGQDTYKSLGEILPKIRCQVKF